MQRVWVNVWGDTVWCPRWAVPRLEWELDPNVGAANPGSLVFYYVALFLLVQAMKVLAGQLVSFFPSLPLFPSIPLHPLYAAGSPGTALGGSSTSSDPRKGKDAA